MHFLIFTNLQCLLYDPRFFQNSHYSKKMSLCYNLCMYLIVSKLVSWHLQFNFLLNALWFEYHVSVNGRVFDVFCEWCIHVWSTFNLLLISLLENQCLFLQVEYHGILVLITMEINFGNIVRSSYSLNGCPYFAYCSDSFDFYHICHFCVLYIFFFHSGILVLNVFSKILQQRGCSISELYKSDQNSGSIVFGRFVSFRNDSLRL